MEDKVTFTWQGLLDGARMILPLAFGAFTYGVVFGVLARQAGLSPVEALLMSSLVFAGASQFVALGLWTLPLPVVALIVTTLIVNLRHVLMGAALRPWFGRLSAPHAYGSMFFMTDENWAMTTRQFASGSRDAALLLGSGLTLFVAWVSATLVGEVAGAVVPDPTAIGLDFVFTAVFLSLLIGLWRGRSDLLPWLAAAVVALAAAYWLPGKWYILLGGLVGGLVGAWRHAR
ncbi:MAG TPA: AzlC family ABC transporter permease [Ktedonobacterales bacterium]|jgi:4-azaleucine resistance transporter AzlC|nr:AzlC family ABC transporter permease [Ktedonobacterales bacterium]